jgi:peptide deformylase
VGVLLRVIVLQMPGEQPFAIINPEIIERMGERDVIEGCLSIPGYVGEIKRSASIKLRGKDRIGTKLKITAEDLLAEALEHEVDHLNGILYIDYLESQDKLHKVEPKSEEEQLG